MNQELTMQNLERAIELFYGRMSDEQITDATALNRTRLHDWLIRAENSTEMWPFIWPLLNPNNSDVIQYFGVNALYNKLSRNWDQIESNFAELKSRIWQVILYYEENSGSKLTLGKLCSAFAVLIIQSIGKQWPTAIDEMIANLSNANNNSNSESKNNTQTTQSKCRERLIFNILESIKIEWKKKMFDKELTGKIRAILNRNEPVVMDLVNAALRSLVESSSFQDSNVEYDSMLRFANSLTACSQKWIPFGNDDIVYDSAVHIFDLFVKIYSSKLSFTSYTHEESELTQSVYDWVSNVFEVNETDVKKPDLIRRLLILFTDKIVPVLENEIKSNGSNDDDIAELVIAFAKITELGMREIYVSIGCSLEYKPTALIPFDTCTKILSTALLCQSVPGSYPLDESFSNQMLSFWSTMLEYCDMDDKRTYVGKLDSLFAQLLPVLLEKCRLHCFDRELMAEDNELFVSYREDIADTLIAIYTHFNKLVMDFMCNYLQQWFASDMTDWRTLELCLFALQAIGGLVNSGEDANRMYEMLRLICERIDFDRYDYRTEASALDLIKNTIGGLENYMDMLPVILTFLMKSVRKSNLGMQATLCFKDLLSSHEKSVLTYSDTLFSEFYHLISTNRQTGLLSDIDAIRLLHSLCRLIRVFELSRYLTALEMILSPTLVQIEDNINANNEELLSVFVHNLEKISTIFLWLKPEVRVQYSKTNSTAFSYVNGVVQNLLQKFCRIQQTVYFKHEKVKISLSTVCHTIIQKFTSDLPDLTFSIVRFLFILLKEYNYSRVLVNIGSILPTCYAQEANQELMQQIFSEMFRIVRDKVSTDSKPITEDGTKFNFVNDYFSMLKLVTNENNLFLGNCHDDIFNGVIEFANNCLLISSCPIQKNVAIFLITLISKKSSNENFARRLHNVMPVILTNLFCVFRKPVPQTIIESLTTILRIAKQYFRSEFPGWLRSILIETNSDYDRNHFPTAHITHAQKEEFLNAWNSKERGFEVMSKALALFAARCCGNTLFSLL